MVIVNTVNDHADDDSYNDIDAEYLAATAFTDEGIQAETTAEN